MKVYADRHRTSREFEIRDWVYLHLRPYRQMSVSIRRNLKLSPTVLWIFSGHSENRTGRLQAGSTPKFTNLPCIPCFSSQKTTRNTNHSPGVPALTPEGTLTAKPEKILTRRLMKKGNRAGVEVLIQWDGATEEDATWEDLEVLRGRFSDLVGKVLWWKGLCYASD